MNDASTDDDEFAPLPDTGKISSPVVRRVAPPPEDVGEFEPGAPDMPTMEDTLKEEAERQNFAAERRVGRRDNAKKTSGLEKLKKIIVPISTVAFFGGIAMVVAPVVKARLGFTNATAMQDTYHPHPIAPAGLITSGYSHIPGQPMPGTSPSQIVPNQLTMPNVQPSSFSSTPPIPTVNSSEAMVSNANTQILNELKALQGDIDTRFMTQANAISDLRSTVVAQGQELASLQAEIANLTTSNDKPVAAAQGTADIVAKPATEPSAPTNYPDRVLHGWHLRGISQTEAAFTSPDGYNIYTHMGHEIRGLHARLIKLQPYDGSWEAVTAAGLIRP